VVSSDYGLNGRLNTSKLVLDDYMEFDHVQYIIQRGGSVVLVPYALKVILETEVNSEREIRLHIMFRWTHHMMTTNRS
jgi:hypothetical protein